MANKDEIDQLLQEASASIGPEKEMVDGVLGTVAGIRYSLGQLIYGSDTNIQAALRESTKKTGSVTLLAWQDSNSIDRTLEYSDNGRLLVRYGTDSSRIQMYHLESPKKTPVLPEDLENTQVQRRVAGFDDRSALLNAITETQERQFGREGISLIPEIDTRVGNMPKVMPARYSLEEELYYQLIGDTTGKLKDSLSGPQLIRNFKTAISTETQS